MITALQCGNVGKKHFLVYISSYFKHKHKMLSDTNLLTVYVNSLR